MKGVIIYKGKYGATRQYAEWLGELLRLPVLDLDNAGPEILAQCDYLLLGASVYMGRTLHKEWLERYTKILQEKKIFYFIVCGTPSSEKKKLDEIVEHNIPSTLLRVSSVWFLRGRVIKAKLSWKDRFMLKMGARLQKDLEEKKRMLQDFDDVREDNLLPIHYAVNEFIKKGRPAATKSASQA